jgi:beta-fructofuranosidase
MQRRKFIETLSASTLLAGAAPGWSAKPWLHPSLAPAAQNAGAAGEREFFYRPVGAWAADFIPFYDKGHFHLFYLHDWRDIPNHGEGTPWYQISTDDFVHFTEHGEMLARGSKDEQDLYVFTGSVIKGEGRYHIFFVGHNPYYGKQGKPVEGIMHAVSDDLLHWQKLPGDTIFAPPDRFERDDWRDPLVFWNEEAKEYWMLTAARVKNGPHRRRGCTALCASKDLSHWEVREPFWTPGLYYTHECPDLFKMGDWWYLLYSEFTERLQTHYRMSRSLSGPWLGPDNDTFDGRGYYAAKTASDGHRRFLFGWVPTRDEQKDFKGWNWGGNLMVHELVQESDGTLNVKVPATVDAAIHENASYEFKPGLGPARISPDGVELNVPGSFGCSAAGTMPLRCKIEATVAFEDNTRGCGIMLHANDDLNTAYYIRLEPARHRLVLDCWGRPGDVPYWIELERPLKLEPGRPVDLKVFVDGTVCVAYASNRIAMSTRLYNLKQGSWGVFVNEGVARFRNVRISV